MAVGLWPVLPFLYEPRKRWRPPGTQNTVSSHLPEAPGPYTWRNEDGEEDSDILKLSFVAGERWLHKTHAK